MIGEALVDLLKAERYQVEWVPDAETAEIALHIGYFSLLILDLGLPVKDGLSVLRNLRSRKDVTPVLIATARDALEQRILGLDLGADDYIIKPFEFSELLARVRALLRRSNLEAAVQFSYGGVTIDVKSREIRSSGRLVNLSAKEWAVLEIMLMRPGMVFSRRQLEERLYSWKTEVASNAIEVHIHSLRKKLGSDIIQNIRGVGYMTPKSTI